jgi:hypothetical protein
MKALSISLGALCLLLTGCNRQSEEALIENTVSNTLSAQGNVQQVDLTKGADNNYSGTASIRTPDGQSVRFNCTARHNAAQEQFDIACGQVIDQVLLEQLKANMRRSLEQQSLTVADLQLSKQDEDHVTGFAQVSDPNSGESARLGCTGARQQGGRIMARCDVPGPAAAGAPPAEGEQADAQ